MKKSMTILTFVLIVAALIFIGAGQASAQVVVDNDGKAVVGNCNSHTTTPYTTIQAGIDAAAEGETVFVCPGKYVEDLVIQTTGLNLEGSGYKKTTIVGIATLPDSAFPQADPNIDIQADGVSIHGFTIKSPEVNADEYSSGIVLIGTNIKIYDNRFKVGAGDVSQAIQTWRDETGGLSDISGLNISHNTFTHLSPIPAGGHGYEGIYINQQPDPPTPQNPVIIQNNSFEGELIRAITTERSNTLILDNEITTKHRSDFGGEYPRGIEIQNFGTEGADINNVDVVDNEIHPDKRGFFGVGINVSSGDGGNTFLYGNEVKKAEVGVSVQSPGNILTKNEVEESGTLDCEDGTTDTGTAGTANTWIYNTGKHNDPHGICKAISNKDRDDGHQYSNGKDKDNNQYDWGDWWSWGKRGAGHWDDFDHHD